MFHNNNLVEDFTFGYKFIFTPKYSELPVEERVLYNIYRNDNVEANDISVVAFEKTNMHTELVRIKDKLYFDRDDNCIKIEKFRQKIAPRAIREEIDVKVFPIILNRYTEKLYYLNELE